MKSVLCRAAAVAWMCACAPHASGAVSAAAQSPDPFAIDVAHGVIYQGIRRNNVEAFLGIRYGQDTGGENRFRPPRAFSAQPGTIVRATAVGPGCPQDPGGSAEVVLQGFTDISEDCLSLNIVRPPGTTGGARLAVMVWIYGGGLWVGRAQDFYTNPDDLVDQSVRNGLPVIHVAMNYRLGVFGFAQNDALKAEGSMNAGLRDQRLALEWVRDNIEQFGGDPHRITIFGQSSGGLSVGLHIMAYGGEKPLPFRQAICQSQALEHGILDDFTINAMRDVVTHLGIVSDLQSAATVAALRQLDTGTLLNASLATHTTAIMDGDIWLPAVDGDFLPAAPSELIRAHRFGAARVMIGWCQDDENSLTNFSIRTPDDTRRTIAGFAPRVSPTNLDRLLALYPVTEFRAGEALSAEFYRAARIKRDLLMACQPIHYGRHLAAAGNDVYLYEWNQTLLDKVDETLLGYPAGLGVFHLSDVPYVYHNPDSWAALSVPVNATDSDLRLADRASRTFSTFASAGRPGLPGRNTFQGFDRAFGADDDIRIFVAGGPTEGSWTVDGPALREQRLRERCGFLNSPEMIAQLRY